MKTSKYDHLRPNLDLLIGQDPNQPDLLTFLEELEEEDARLLEEARLAREAAILAAREASARARTAAAEASARAREAASLLAEAQRQAELMALEEIKLAELAAKEEAALSQFDTAPEENLVKESNPFVLTTTDAETIEDNHTPLEDSRLEDSRLEDSKEDNQEKAVLVDKLAEDENQEAAQDESEDATGEPLVLAEETSEESQEGASSSSGLGFKNLTLSLPAHYATPSFAAPSGATEPTAETESSETEEDVKEEPQSKRGWIQRPELKVGLEEDVSKAEVNTQAEALKDEVFEDSPEPVKRNVAEATLPKARSLKTMSDEKAAEVKFLKTLPSPQGEPVLEQPDEDEDTSDLTLEEAELEEVEPEVVEPLVLKAEVHGSSLVGKAWLAHQNLFIKELGTDDSPLVRSIFASKLENHEKYAKDSSEIVRAQVAKVARDQKLLQDLSADLNSSVRLGVSENPNADATTLLLLAGDSYHEIFLSALRNPSCPHSTLSRALANSDPEIVEAALKNESLIAEDFSLGMLKEGAHRYLYTRSAALSDHDFFGLVSSPDFSEQVKSISNATRPLPLEVAKTVRHGSDTLVAAYAATPLTEEEVNALLLHRSAAVRRSLAANPSLSSEHLQHLANDLVPLVRAGAAGNPSTPSSSLFSLATDMGESRSKRRLGRSKDPIDGDIEPLGPLVALNPSADEASLEAALSVSAEAAWPASQHPNATPRTVILAMRAYSPVVELTEVWARPLAKSLLKIDQRAAASFVEDLENFSGTVQELEDRL